MTGREAYLELKTTLAAAGIEDADFEAEVLVRHVCGRPHLEVYEVKGEAWRKLQLYADARAKRAPLQYILGRWQFMDLELLVGPGVLIPRPETEEVCLAGIELVKHMSAPVVLDLCSGSGAIALAVQKALPGASVTAVEGDVLAYAFLERNVEAFVRRFPKAMQPRAVLDDVMVYNEQVVPHTVHLILANPPYVDGEDYESLAPEVLAEPKQALIAGEEGLAFYKAIAKRYRSRLKLGGWLVFEIGAGQGGAVRDILLENRYASVEVRRDMAGHDRIVLGQRPRDDAGDPDEMAEGAFDAIEEMR